MNNFNFKINLEDCKSLKDLYNILITEMTKKEIKSNNFGMDEYKDVYNGGLLRIVAPTGSGKTRTCFEFIRDTPNMRFEFIRDIPNMKFIYAANNKSLLESAVKSCEKFKIPHFFMISTPGTLESIFNKKSLKNKLFEFLNKLYKLLIQLNSYNKLHKKCYDIIYKLKEIHGGDVFAFNNVAYELETFLISFIKDNNLNLEIKKLINNYSDVIDILFPYRKWSQSKNGVLIASLRKLIYGFFGVFEKNSISDLQNTIIFIDEAEDFKLAYLDYIAETSVYENANEFVIKFLNYIRKVLSNISILNEEELNKKREVYNSKNINFTEMIEDFRNFESKYISFYNKFINTQNLPIDYGSEISFTTLQYEKLQKNNTVMFVNNNTFYENNEYLYYDIIVREDIKELIKKGISYNHYPSLNLFFSEDKLKNRYELKDLLIELSQLFNSALYLCTKYKEIRKQKINKDFAKLFNTLVSSISKTYDFSVTKELMIRNIESFAKHNKNMDSILFNDISQLYDNGYHIWFFKDIEHTGIHSWDIVPYPLIMLETPEKILLNLIKNNKVILLSSTLYIDRIFDNINFQWIYNKMLEENNIFYLTKDEEEYMFNTIYSICNKNHVLSNKKIKISQVIEFSDYHDVQGKNLDEIIKLSDIHIELKGNSKSEDYEHYYRYDRLKTHLGILYDIITNNNTTHISFANSYKDFQNFLVGSGGIKNLIDEKVLNTIGFKIVKLAEDDIKFLSEIGILSNMHTKDTLYDSNIVNILKLEYGDENNKKYLFIYFLDAKEVKQLMMLYEDDSFLLDKSNIKNRYEKFMQLANENTKIWLCTQNQSTAKGINFNYKNKNNIDMEIEALYLVETPFYILESSDDVIRNENFRLEKALLKNVFTIFEYAIVCNLVSNGEISSKLNLLLENTILALFSEENKNMYYYNIYNELRNTDEYYLFILAFIIQILGRVTRTNFNENFTPKVKKIGMSMAVAQTLKNAIKRYESNFPNIPIQLASPIIPEVIEKINNTKFESNKLKNNINMVNIINSNLDNLTKKSISIYRNGNGFSSFHFPEIYENIRKEGLKGNIEYKFPKCLISNNFDSSTLNEFITIKEAFFVPRDSKYAYKISNDNDINIIIKNMKTNMYLNSFVSLYCGLLINNNFDFFPTKNSWTRLFKPTLAEEYLKAYIKDVVNFTDIVDITNIDRKYYEKCDFFSKKIPFYWDAKYWWSETSTLRYARKNFEFEYQSKITFLRGLDPNAKLIIVRLIDTQYSKDSITPRYYDINMNIIPNVADISDFMDRVAVVALNCFDINFQPTMAFKDFIEKILYEVQNEIVRG